MAKKIYLSLIYSPKISAGLIDKEVIIKLCFVLFIKIKARIGQKIHIHIDVLFTSQKIFSHEQLVASWTYILKDIHQIFIIIRTT